MQRRGTPAALVSGVDISWHEQAACRGSNIGLFFVERGDPKAATKLAAARSICGRCPVRAESADAGRREPVGMWSGLTAEERMGTRARRTRTAS